MSTNTAELIAVLLLAGQRVVLQRVARTMSAAGLAEQLTTLTERPCGVVTDPLSQTPGVVRVLDARMFGVEQFAAWEPAREQLGTPESPLVVMLDMVSGPAILRAAPHVVSWAGGVRLPAERLVRFARGPDEIALGQRALRNALHEHPEFARRNLGVTVVVDIASERLFEPRRDVSAISRAREELDEGIAYEKNLEGTDLP